MQYLVMAQHRCELTCESMTEARAVAVELLTNNEDINKFEIHHCRRVTEITMKVNTTSRIV